MAEFKRGTTIEGIPVWGLPIGINLMYDGEAWIDNSSVSGWYQCIAENTGHGCLDFTWRLPRGGTTGDVRSGGGNNSIYIGANKIPWHNHNQYHVHAGQTIYWDYNDHQHTYEQGVPDTGLGGKVGPKDCGPDQVWTCGDYSAGHFLEPYTSVNYHTHYTTIDVPNYGGNGDWNNNSYIYNNGGALQTHTAFEICPAYRTTVIIRRCD